jgi:anti-sigma regulatory factor (Ser/Thr protein kinase)
MPGMDGMALLQEVKSRNPLTPVVLISGYEEARMIVRALKMGAEDFLAKPFNRERLLRSLEQALTTRLPVRLGRDGCCSVHQVTEIVIPSRPEFIRLLINQMCLSAEQAGYVEDQLDNSLRLALVEALTNAMEHGNKWDSEKTVRVKASFSRSEMKVTISDQGRGFSWHSLPDPTSEVNLTAERGRGVFLMRTIVDEVKFNQPGNQVTLVSRKKSNPG